MFWKTAVLAIGLLELLFPRRFVDFWMRHATPGGEPIEFRPWVYHIARLEGLILVLWVVTRDHTTEKAFDIDLGRVPPRIKSELDAPTPVSVIDTSTDDTESPVRSEELPTVNPGTRRYELASVLYHADDPVTVADVIDLSAETDWEQTRSGASAELYKMYRDGIVDRRERQDNGRYEYWLTRAGRAAVDSSTEPIEPNPFAQN